jgi:hypothetical protein
LRFVQGQARNGAIRESGHPLVLSYQPGGDWIWCYVDQLAMEPD